MKVLEAEALGRSGRREGKCYELPDADTMRRSFAKHLGHEVADIF